MSSGWHGGFAKKDATASTALWYRSADNNFRADAMAVLSLTSPGVSNVEIVGRGDGVRSERGGTGVADADTLLSVGGNEGLGETRTTPITSTSKTPATTSTRFSHG